MELGKPSPFFPKVFALNRGNSPALFPKNLGSGRLGFFQIYIGHPPSAFSLQVAAVSRDTCLVPDYRHRRYSLWGEALPSPQARPGMASPNPPHIPRRFGSHRVASEVSAASFWPLQGEGRGRAGLCHPPPPQPLRPLARGAEGLPLRYAYRELCTGVGL